MIRIVIADDHPIFRAGLQGLLSAQDEFEVVGEAANGREAVAVVRHASPDVLLVDLQMPELDGLGAIREIRAVAPATRILVLTTYDSDGDILRAVEAGATVRICWMAPTPSSSGIWRSTSRTSGAACTAGRCGSRSATPRSEGSSPPPSSRSCSSRSCTPSP